MEPVEGRYQAATMRVKAVSSENVVVGMADEVSILGRQHEVMRKGECGLAFPESQAAAWYRKGCVGTWETLSGSPKGIAADKPKRARRRQCLAGSRTAS